MSPRLALTIGAVQAFAFGLPLLLFPASMLAISGLTLPDGGIAIARGAGATVTGLGVIDWLLRGATGEVLRSLLGGNLVVQILSLLVNASEVLAGHLPAQAASASLLHLILSAMFVFALLRADRGAKAQPRGGAVAR